MASLRLPRPSGKTRLERVPIIDTENPIDARTRALSRLLKKGHRSVAVLREPSLKLHNHLPHLLGSAYSLGADEAFLEKAFEKEMTTLVGINGSFKRKVITKQNWRDFFGQKMYNVAYGDFLDAEIRQNDGDWKPVLWRYLNAEPAPLIHGLSGGLGHPFIHLAYAHEFNSAGTAAQGFALACMDFDPLHGVLDEPPPDTSTYKTKNLREIFARIQADARFGELGLQQPDSGNAATIIERGLDTVLEHWNAWEIDDPVQQLEHVLDTSVLLAISTGSQEKSYDFFLIHLMTMAHALRVLWHDFPPEKLVVVLKEYLLASIVCYIAQMRPPLSMVAIEEIDIDDRDWDWIVQRTLDHKWALDSHFFKVVRAAKVFSETYGEKDDFYLKAAVKFVTEFDGWKGFGELFGDGFSPAEESYNVSVLRL